jgi:hypothetical protein
MTSGEVGYILFKFTLVAWTLLVTYMLVGGW